MGDTAELVALAGVGALDGRGDLELVDPAGDDVHLHEERRDAEVVDDVGRVQVELDGLVDRQHERRDVGAGAGRVDVGVVGEVVLGHRGAGVLLADTVVERPRPLLAEHLDGHVGVGVEVEHLVLDPHGVEEEHDAHQDRGDRVEDLERQVVARLPRHLVVAAAAELHHGVEDEAPDDDAGDHGGDPGPLPELVGVGTLRRWPGRASRGCGSGACRPRNIRPAPASSRPAARPSGCAAGARLKGWGLADPLTSLSLGPSRHTEGIPI